MTYDYKVSEDISHFGFVGFSHDGDDMILDLQGVHRYLWRCKTVRSCSEQVFPILLTVSCRRADLFDAVPVRMEEHHSFNKLSSWASSLVGLRSHSLQISVRALVVSPGHTCRV